MSIEFESFENLLSLASVNSPTLVNILFQSRNWDLIRNKITEAKISDALSVLKYEINGKKVSVLRPLGDGGYSDVYEVYDKARPAASMVERGEGTGMLSTLSALEMSKDKIY